MSSSEGGRPSTEWTADDRYAVQSMCAFLDALAVGAFGFFVSEIDYVTLWASRVGAGEDVQGPKVRQACARHLNDLKTGILRGLKFSWPHARHVVDFFGFTRHAKGEWRGKAIRLEPWQVFGLGCPYGWLRWDADRGRWLRRFKTVYWEVAKKNGKSTTLGGVGLYGLLADDEPGAEIYAAATRKVQAQLVFEPARQMVLASPELRSRVRVLKLNLHVEETFSKFEPVSADADLGDGVNPHYAIVDELHRLKNRSLLAIFDQGMGARRQPLVFIITTAGNEEPGTPYDDEHEYASKVLDGALEDDSYFALIFCPDPADDDFDETTWRKANPNLGISVALHDMKSAAAKARASAQALADFRRLRLNRRSSDADSAIKMEHWRRNTAGGKLDIEALRGRACHLAVDLSSKTDISALIALFPPEQEDDRFIILPKFWVPATGVHERGFRDRAPYQRWIEEEYITATLGNVVDYRAILQMIVGDEDESIEGFKQMFNVIDVAFDPWNAGTLINDLQEEGLSPFEFPQRTSHYAFPTNEFLGMVQDGRFEHYSNPVLQWMASNLRLVRDHNENPMPSKKKSTARIDGVSGSIMALARALLGDDEGASIYEKRSLVGADMEAA